MVETKPWTVGGLILCTLYPVLQTKESVGLVLVLLLGLVDDARDLSPLRKLVVETLIAWVVTCSIPAVVWIVFFMNAMNLSDNMDGLAIGLGMIAGVAFGMGELTLVLSILLPFNLKPAKIYLGDLGSLSLGYLLALQVTNHPSGAVFLLVPIVDTLYVSISRLATSRRCYNNY